MLIPGWMYLVNKVMISFNSSWCPRNKHRESPSIKPCEWAEWTPFCYYILATRYLTAGLLPDPFGFMSILPLRLKMLPKYLPWKLPRSFAKPMWILLLDRDTGMCLVLDILRPWVRLLCENTNSTWSFHIPTTAIVFSTCTVKWLETKSKAPKFFFTYWLVDAN
jgi:hypothetical protein